MNPLLVRIFDPTKGSVLSQLLDICTCKKSTSEALFEMINQTLSQFSISWKNCVAMLLDNTSVNLERKNSIMTRVLNINPTIYINGCPCHIVHNTASKASAKFTEIVGFEVEDFLVNIYTTGLIKARNVRRNLKAFATFVIKTSRRLSNM